MDTELKKLRKEISLLESDFSIRVKFIEQRISVLENQQLWQDQNSNADVQASEKSLELKLDEGLLDRDVLHEEIRDKAFIPPDIIHE
ncbi:MAG: hypothetical protein HRU20_18270, partial [Pseudomonadales bacterium]|nr:hypothetical protein [Pseudomonadales bacterium]